MWSQHPAFAAVKMTVTLKDVYIIKGKAYYVWNFKIWS